MVFETADAQVDLCDADSPGCETSPSRWEMVLIGAALGRVVGAVVNSISSNRARTWWPHVGPSIHGGVDLGFSILTVQ